VRVDAGTAPAPPPHLQLARKHVQDPGHRPVPPKAPWVDVMAHDTDSEEDIVSRPARSARGCVCACMHVCVRVCVHRCSALPWPQAKAMVAPCCSILGQAQSALLHLEAEVWLLGGGGGKTPARSLQRQHHYTHMHAQTCLQTHTSTHLHTTTHDIHDHSAPVGPYPRLPPQRARRQVSPLSRQPPTVYG